MTNTTTEMASVRNLIRYVKLLQKTGVEYFHPEEGNTAVIPEALRHTDELADTLEGVDNIDELDKPTLTDLKYLCRKLQSAVGEGVLTREADLRNFSIKSVSHSVEEALYRAKKPVRSPGDPPVEGVDEVRAYQTDGMAGVEHVRGSRKFLERDQKMTERMSRSE